MLHSSMPPSVHPASRRARGAWNSFSSRRLVRPLVTLLLLAGCDPRSGRRWISDAANGALTVVDAPSAEFLLTGVDSSFWVLIGPDAGPTGLQVRRAPLALARVDGRWQELYIVEEDHSFPDAIFIVQELWRRDLVSQDSTLVLGDSLVPALAAQYARANPDEVPLEQDELEEEDPSIIAVAELSLLDVVGRYASVEHYADLHLPMRRERHELRRGVVDLSSGTKVRLAALVGEKAAVDLVRRGRAELVAARDSARKVAGPADAAAAAPAAVFYAVGQGDAADGFALPLRPIAMAGGAWWDSARVGLPLADDLQTNSGAGTVAATRRWRRGALTVVATPYDEPARSRSRLRPPAYEDGKLSETLPSQRLTLRDSGGRQWPLGSITSSAQRLYWLDRGGVDADERRALARAFYLSAFQDETLRAASAPGGHGLPGPRMNGALPTPLKLTSARASSPPVAAPLTNSTSARASSRPVAAPLTNSTSARASSLPVAVPLANSTSARASSLPVAAPLTNSTSRLAPVQWRTRKLRRTIRSPILRSTPPAPSR